MTQRALDTRTLNRALLARQLLLGRRKMPVTRALERVGGLQTQYAPSAYIGLWSRLEGFERSRLTRALEREQVIQATLMRVTIHMVSAGDYPLLTEAVRRSRRDWWRRVARARALDDGGHERVASILREALADGPRSRTELVELLVSHGYNKEIWEGAGLWIDMIRVPPSGTWERRRADLYGLAPSPGRIITENEGLEHLVRRYLGGFGPASVGDISSWAGITISTLKPVVDAMTLRRFRAETDSELVDIPRQPIPGPETPAPVRFLPTWDATLLAHARRTQILPEEYRSAIFNSKNPQSLT
ncbi:MAG: winged helix DNA-binding domain-containing protein, partial [Acidimicrobiia bacterium]